jgi:Xylose isomerase-like TIM barrel
MDLATKRDLIQENGLKLGCSRGLTFEADVSSDDSACAARRIVLLEEGVTITAGLGGNYSNVVVHLDTYHMNIEEPDFMQPVLACGKRLGYVHIGESNRGYLGSGTVDFAQSFKALAAIDYQGVRPGLSACHIIGGDIVIATQSS